MYQICDDLKALESLLDSFVDENGEPREATPEELEQMKEWFDVSTEAFNNKFDDYCKFIKNLKISAEIVDGEKKAHKAEMDRLTKRAKALENRAKNVQNLLWFCMQRLKLKKFKTNLFSAQEQNTQISIQPLLGSKLDKVPERFLKPRELDVSAIKDAIKSGELKQGDGTPLGETKLFFIKNGEELTDVRWTQGTALVLR
jgi:hypothetical protein